MKIETKYLSVIETNNYKTSYNVTSATKTLGKKNKGRWSCSSFSRVLWRSS